MHGQSTITITQVENGFIAVLPFQPYEDLEYQQGDTSYGPDVHISGPYRVPESEIRRHARIQKEELLKDDELERLKQENYSNDQELKKVPYGEIKDQNIFIFKTFQEVLSFLNEKYIENK